MLSPSVGFKWLHSGVRLLHLLFPAAEWAVQAAFFFLKAWVQTGVPLDIWTPHALLSTLGWWQGRRLSSESHVWVSPSATVILTTWSIVRRVSHQLLLHFWITMTEQQMGNNRGFRSLPLHWKSCWVASLRLSIIRANTTYPIFCSGFMHLF